VRESLVETTRRSRLQLVLHMARSISLMRHQRAHTAIGGHMTRVNNLTGQHS
jgi:hypothetical protein